MKTVYTGSPDKKLSLKGSALQPYVLDDYTLVITKKSINRYFGHSGKSDWLNDYMHGFMRYGIGATGLLAKLSEPILFETIKKDGFPTLEEAYSVKTLLDACEFILFAKKEGFLSVIELKIATLAEHVLTANRAEPFALQIAEITGLNHLKWKAAQKILETLRYKQKEPAHEWIHGLTDGFWSFLLAQTGTDWKGIAQNPLAAARFTHEWVFGRLPEPLMEKLRQSPPKRSYRSKKNPQKNGHPELSAYLNVLIGLFEVSDGNLGILAQLLDKTHPIRRSVSLEPPGEPRDLPVFARQLREAVSLKK